MNQLALVEHIFEIRIDFAVRHAFELSRLSLTVVGNTDNEIAAAPVVDVVGKGANRLERSLGIPCLLELNASPLDHAATKQRLPSCLLASS